LASAPLFGFFRAPELSGCAAWNAGGRRSARPAGNSALDCLNFGKDFPLFRPQQHVPIQRPVVAGLLVSAGAV
jgi:hypothetical protein